MHICERTAKCTQHHRSNMLHRLRGRLGVITTMSPFYLPSRAHALAGGQRDGQTDRTRETERERQLEQPKRERERELERERKDSRASINIVIRTVAAAADGCWQVAAAADRSVCRHHEWPAPVQYIPQAHFFCRVAWHPCNPALGAAGAERGDTLAWQEKADPIGDVSVAFACGAGAMHRCHCHCHCHCMRLLATPKRCTVVMRPCRSASTCIPP